MGWAKGGGAVFRRGGGAKGQDSIDFPPSHLLCTIKSQLGANGGPMATGGWNKKFLEMHVYIVIMYFLKQIDIVWGGGGGDLGVTISDKFYI